MSGITYLNRITGASNNLVYLETTDSTATATTTGYITAQAANILAVQDGGWTWETNDCIMLSASDGISWCSINSTFTTLTAFAGFGSGDVTFTSPSIANRIPTFTNTTGNIADSPYSIVGNLLVAPVDAGVTAHSGGGQTSAVLLTGGFNTVTTVAAAGDSVKLEPSVAGAEQTVANNGANPMQVYGSGTDTINGVATGTGVSQAAGTVVTYRCAVAGNWISNTITKGTGTVSANAVTINAPAGEITTTSLTTASGADATAITFTNSFISAGSVVLCTINGGTNTTNGVTVKAVPGSGSATLTITNGNVAAAALNGTLIIGFQVI